MQMQMMQSSQTTPAEGGSEEHAGGDASREAAEASAPSEAARAAGAQKQSEQAPAAPALANSDTRESGELTEKLTALELESQEGIGLQAP
jgi:hypothetical protein